MSLVLPYNACRKFLIASVCVHIGFQGVASNGLHELSPDLLDAVLNSDLEVGDGGALVRSPTMVCSMFVFFWNFILPIPVLCLEHSNPM